MASTSFSAMFESAIFIEGGFPTAVLGWTLAMSDRHFNTIGGRLDALWQASATEGFVAAALDVGTR